MVIPWCTMVGNTMVYHGTFNCYHGKTVVFSAGARWRHHYNLDIQKNQNHVFCYYCECIHKIKYNLSIITDTGTMQYNNDLGV